MNGGPAGPRLTVHYAQTLDGRIATCTGHSRWVSCDATLELAHRLRAEHDAVLVGVGTVLADDPQLTVRLVEGRSPMRVILDSTLRIPAGARVLEERVPSTRILTTDRAEPRAVEALRRHGAEVSVVDRNAAGRIDLPSAMSTLSALGVSSVLVEGGATVITALLRERLADRLVVCIAPKIVGTGIDAVADLGIVEMGDAIRLDELSVTTVGCDLVVDARPVYARSATRA